MKQNNEPQMLFTILKVSSFDLVVSTVTVSSAVINRFHVFKPRPRLSHSSPLQTAMLEIVPAGARVTHPSVGVLVLCRIKITLQYFSSLQQQQQVNYPQATKY